MKRLLGGLLLLVVVVVSLAALLGSMLPVAHTVSASVVVNAPQAQVWQRIVDTASQPTWRTGLKSVKMDTPRDGHPCWTEDVGMKMPLCESLAAAPTTRIVAIADPKLAFGGGWTYELTPVDANSTRVIITENGTVRGALWRFLGHYVMHEDSNIKRYEADLQKLFAR
jgi:hypothetical protein